MAQSTYDPPVWSDATLPNDTDKETFRDGLYRDDTDVVKDFTRRFGKTVLNAFLFRDNISPLMYAASKGATDCLRYLIGQGADLHAVDLYDRNACYHAAIQNKPESIYALSVAGANINEFNAINLNPILAAAYNSSAEVFKALLECGADIEVKINGPEGHTLDELVMVTTDDRIPDMLKAHKQDQAQKKLLQNAHAAEKVSCQGVTKTIHVRKLKPRAP